MRTGKKTLLFGRRLAALMPRRGVNAEDIERATGIPSESVAIWLSPDRMASADTTRRNLVALADFLGCTPAYLCGAEEYAPARPHGDLIPFAPRLPVLLNACGKTLHGMFASAGINDARYREWKKGGEPLVSDLVRLRAYLGCPLDDLLFAPEK